MKTLYYHLHLLEPTLVTALDGDPNSAVAFDYIPGSVIRGAVIGLFLRRGQMDELDATDDATRRVFFSDSTRYLNAYPLVKDKRSLPVPKSWSVEKGQKTPITDSARTNETLKKGVGGFAVVTEKQEVVKASIQRFIAVHTQRDRQKGRATKDSGALYRYDSLAAGQMFAGTIICENDDDADWLHRFINDDVEIQIGGARSAGYGRVRFEHVAASDSWIEAVSNFEPGQLLVVTLLSDTILRNGEGEYETNLETLREALARRLDIAPETFGTADQSYLETTFIGGFNRKWGLPLPQTAALKMGSTIVFTNHSLNRDQVDQLIRWGIGERRAEGFGRVGVNIYTKDQYALAEIDKDKTSGDVQAITLYKLLSPKLARRKLRQLLDEQIIEKANVITVRNPPHSSQINALRQVVQNALRTDPIGLEKLDEAIQHINERGATRRQFDRARVGDVKLTKWVSNTSKADDEWDNPAVKSLLTRSDVNEEQERTRYNLHLVDAVLARAAKQKGNRNE